MSAQYNDYVTEWFGSSGGAEAWSAHGLYDPRSNQGPYNYNNKIYRMQYALELVPDAHSPDARALDLGCGGGVYVPALKAKGYDVTALDISEEMIARTEELCRRLGIEATTTLGDCNATGLPDASFDVVLAVGLIEHQRSDAPLVDEVRRILRPGGTLVISIRNYLSPYMRVDTLYRRLTGRLAWNSREHNPFAFYRMLRENGFEVGERRFSHFYFLPPPMPRLLPRLEARVGKALERMNATPYGYTASTMIVAARRR